MKMSENINNRVHWIDIAKCIAIFGVVLAHTSSHYLCAFVQTYNVAFFFFLSGITFCRDEKSTDLFHFDNRSIKIFVSKLIRHITLPYFSWGLISIAVYFVVGHFIQIGANSTNLLNNIRALLYGNSNSQFFEWNGPLWFLPALACVWIIWFAYLKLTASFCVNAILKKIGCIALIACGGGWIIYQGYGNTRFIWFMELESAIAMTFFFGLGIGLRIILSNEYLKNLMRVKCFNLILFIVFFIVGLILVKNNACPNTRVEEYGNPIIFISASLSFITAFSILSYYLYQNALLEYIGKRSMAIMVMHKFPIMFVKTLFPAIEELVLKGNILAEVFLCVIAVICCLVVEPLVNLIAPWLFGKQKTH